MLLRQLSPPELEADLPSSGSELPANKSGLGRSLESSRWLPPIAVMGPRRPRSDSEKRPLPIGKASFAAVVLLPIAIAALYYSVIAADQYVAEFRFGLRAVERPAPALAWPFDANRGAGQTQAESQIVVQYLGSRAIVEQLETELPVRTIFASPHADWFARLDPAAPIETLVEYWRHQVDAFYEPTDGTVTVRLRAFTPQDSLLLAQAIVTASEHLVNELSARARNDVLQNAEQDVAKAEARLKSALARIRDFRDREGLIDPGKTADATTGMAARLRDELIRAEANLATLQIYMRDDSPEVKILKARIASLETQQRGLVRQLTDAGDSHGSAPPRTLSSYEELESERRFAEAAYQHALEALDRARANADRQQLYVATFVPPSSPEEALYPHRWRSLATVALVAFAVWGIGGLTLRSIREHL